MKGSDRSAPARRVVAVGASTKGRPVKGSDPRQPRRPPCDTPCLNEGPPGEGQRRPRSRATRPRRVASTKGRPVKGSDLYSAGSTVEASSCLNEGPPGEGQRLHLHSSMPDQQKRPRRREVRISRSESGRFMSRPDHKFPLTRDNTSARGRGRPPGRGDLSHQTMKDSREVTTRSRPTHLNDALLPPTGPRSQRSTESLARSKTPVSSP